MKLTPRMHLAIDRAAEIHRNHKRRGPSKTPYVTHLFAVAVLLDHYGADEDTVLAGLMHDSVEDIKGYEFEDLEKDCGPVVREMVEHLTEPRIYEPTKTPEEHWYHAKDAYIAQIAKSSREVRMVSAADKIHNMNSAFYGIQEGSDTFLQSFIKGALEKQIWFVSELEKHFEGHIPELMLSEYREAKERLVGLKHR
jgi:GTP pyrophosphokinase